MHSNIDLANQQKFVRSTFKWLLPSIDEPVYLSNIPLES